jgi:hypothetical protein
MASDDIDQPAQVQHDLLLTRSPNFGSAISRLELKGEALAVDLRRFSDNVERIRVMAISPRLMASAGVWCMLAISQATFNVLGKPTMIDTDLGRLDDVNAEFARVLKDWNHDPLGDVMGGFTSEVLRFHKAHYIPKFSEGFLAFLAAQVTGIWTAFETLAKDVWLTAVNTKPATLGPKITQAIPVKKLQKFQYDLRGHMGELLADEFRFDSLKNLNQAYQAIFNGEPEILAVFSDAGLNNASRVRNCVVHDAGKAANNFAKSMTGKPWEAVKDGELLPLDGDNVSVLAGSMVACGNSLIKLVDAWIAKAK